VNSAGVGLELLKLGRILRIAGQPAGPRLWPTPTELDTIEQHDDLEELPVWQSASRYCLRINARSLPQDSSQFEAPHCSGNWLAQCRVR